MKYFRFVLHFFISISIFQATCTYLGQGEHECECNVGYKGNGQKCKDEDECKLGRFRIRLFSNCFELRYGIIFKELITATKMLNATILTVHFIVFATMVISATVSRVQSLK